jgi:hypothetical protein
MDNLYNLGLSKTQIDKILERLSPDKIPLFIEKWTTQQKQPTQRKRDTPSIIPYNNQGATKYLPRHFPDLTARATSDEMNKIYQEKTQSRIDPIVKLEILATQMFGTPTDGYTFEYLHTKYKQLAISLHPDKHGGNGAPFHMLTNCYNLLKTKVRETDTILEHRDGRETKDVMKQVQPPEKLFDSKFDPNLFNDYYSKNSFGVESKGHGDWLKNSELRTQPERPSESNFNSVYENHKKHLQTTSNLSLIKVSIPKDDIKNNNFALLGGDESNDFTGMMNNGTSYTDIRIAHAETAMIADDPEKDRNISKEFALANQRLTTTPEVMSSSEESEYSDFQRKEREKEDDRNYRVRQYDEDIAIHYENTNRKKITM